ncbi:hypothetical protein LRS74_10025 [Streptomyces sp. LX-29]|uniref:hypothetical protein n=1 Tax=Streptomyces sp. LX-29 TaxID=2900152 RepID=UPI00240E962F|nr:hypothetical protein [Streptomyces sp. LX-29]WFB07350.1 hypothetical protein LRS74_10025 [Streptomyces sp. LX-29]
MTDRTLEALGFAELPYERPLTYPGRTIVDPVLLYGDELWPLRPTPGRLGSWRVLCPAGAPEAPPGEAPGGASDGASDGVEEPLDAVLTRLGQPPAGARHPLLTVGSNGSPAQLRAKFARLGGATALPMLRARVRGIGVGVTGHISVSGYVAAAPYADPRMVSDLVLCWPDTAQLRAVDASESAANYRRLLLPGSDFPMALPGGERLGGAYLYASVRGVLAGPDGTPRHGGGEQHALLTTLLADSARLRELLGPDPERWVARARGDAAVRAAGTRILREEGWLLPQPTLDDYADTRGELWPRRYDLLTTGP